MRVLGAFLIFLAGPAMADDFVGPLIGHFTSGINCSAATNGRRAAPGTVSGEVNVLSSVPEFVSDSHIVPAVIGIAFGVNAAAQGDIPLSDVTMHISHPPFAGSGTNEQSYATFIGSRDAPLGTLYRFEEGYELAIGEWVMEAQYEGITLFRTSFMVVDPASVPELADLCGYQDLLG